LPRSLAPHPPFGHLLPWEEGGEAALYESSMRIGRLQLILKTALDQLVPVSNLCSSVSICGYFIFQLNRFGHASQKSHAAAHGDPAAVLRFANVQKSWC
jgi:hypothetical protein